jgi:chromosome segregation ATPase
VIPNATHIYISDTDIRIMAQEEADSVEGDMSDDDALEQVKMKDDYDELEEKIDALQNEKEDLESDLEDLREGLDDPDETEKDRISGEIEEAERRIAEINAELGESGDVDKAKEEMVEKAREKVREEIIDEWENGLKDPVSFLVEEHGMYSMEDLMKANFIVIDYDAAAQDAIGSDG